MNGSTLGDILTPIILTLGALGVLRAVLSRFQANRRVAGQELAILESRALSTKHRIHLVECRGEPLLIASSDSGVEVLRSRLPSTAPAPGGGDRAAGAAPESTGTQRELRLVTLVVSVVACVLLLATGTSAETISIQIGSDEAVSPGGLSSTIQTVVFLSLVTVAPSLLLMGTCFTRIVIVLALLRQAIGVQQLPPNQVLVGLALFTTFYVMSPVAEVVRVEAYEPYVAGEMEPEEALTKAMQPIRGFLANFTRESDLALFERPVDGDTRPDAIPMTQLLPAYMMSELRTAFEIGFTIYLPFLVIDLVIASMLISMGMIVLPPIVISLPFKLMLFVLLDGWNLVIGSLVEGLM